MKVFDRSLTLIPIKMHSKYISNIHIKHISNSDQFVSSGMAQIVNPRICSYRGGSAGRVDATRGSKHR
jgi:hypothetical protein